MEVEACGETGVPYVAKVTPSEKLVAPKVGEVRWFSWSLQQPHTWELPQISHNTLEVFSVALRQGRKTRGPSMPFSHALGGFVRRVW